MSAYQQLDEPAEQKEDSKEVQEMMKMNGWLKKQSPNAFKTWQDRYFMVSNNGTQLVYFEDDKAKSKAKGALEIKEIETITQKVKKIKILFSGREFKLKATNEQEAAKWVQCLQVLTQRLQNQAQGLQRQKSNASQKKEKKQWKNIDNESSQIIQQEKEMHSSSHSTEASKIIIEDQNVLMEKIGIKDFIKSQNQDFVNNRLSYGFLGKRSQGKVKYFQKRWFFLISAKSLYPNKYNDEQVLDESKIPPLFELDVIYYFDPEEDQQTVSQDRTIKMLDCQEVIVKDMTKSKESGYTFKINIGDRLYHLMADTELERQKWVQAVKSAMVTSREIKNPQKHRIYKNIDPVCNLYDSTKNLDGRRDKIRQKIQEDMDKIKKSTIQFQDPITNFDALLKYLDGLSADLLQSLYCCLVKEPKRIDIIREYIDFLHEKICDIITIHWDRNHDEMASFQMLTLAFWLHTYADKMKEFCNDDRLLAGVKVLLNIYINRSIDSVEQVVTEIIEFEKTTEPHENENEQLVTQAPVDLFKILNEGFDLAWKACPIKETAFKLAYFARVLIRQYQEGIDLLMENEETNIELCIAICNNTIQLNNQTKQFYQRVLTQGGLTEDEAEKALDLSKIQKKFVTISNTAKDMFFFHFFGRTASSFKKNYMEINLEDILKEVISPAQDPVHKLHDSFARKIWKQLLDVVVFYYFNSFIIGCNKAKKDDLGKFMKKMNIDRDIILNEFDGSVFTNLINQSLVPFNDMSEFMSSSSLAMLQPCQGLRIYFGKAFTQKTVKTLLNLRSDMSKEEKSITLESCANLIQDYNKANKDQISEIEKLKLTDNFGIDDDEEIEEETQDSDDGNRRMDLTLDDDDNIPTTELLQTNDRSDLSNPEEEYISEGFLHKKKPKEKDFFNSLMVNPMKQMVKHIEKNVNLLDLGNAMDWDHRYFRIRNGMIWIYANERSRESTGKLDITKIEDIVAHPVKTLIFTVIMEGGKKHKMKAETKSIRDLWVKSISKEINSILNAQQEKIEAIVSNSNKIPQKTGEGKKPIIKDYDEIQRREKHKKKMEEKRQKMKERQEELQRRKEEKKQAASLKKQLSIMPNIKDNHGYDLGDDKRASTIFSIDSGEMEQVRRQHRQVGCWQRFMICLGVEKDS